MPKVISPPAISFHFQSPYRLVQRKQIRGLLTELVRKERKEVESLAYVFCSDDYLLEINRQYLNHDFYTDIITFDLSPGKSAPTIGEIYISIDRVKENAGIHGVTIHNEMLRVIFHGALHLCGFKDKSQKESLLMREAEDRYLALYERMFHVKHPR